MASHRSARADHVLANVRRRGGPKATSGRQQVRTSADAKDVFGLCGLPPGICYPDIVEHSVIDTATARYDQDIGGFCAFARLCRQHRQAEVRTYWVHRHGNKVDRPTRNTRKHFEGTSVSSWHMSLTTMMLICMRCSTELIASVDAVM